MNFVPVTAEHCMTMRHLAAIHSGYDITPEIAVELENIGGTAAIDDDGHAVAIAGILPKWDGVGVAWAWLSRDWRRAAREITAEVIRGLDASPLRRIELAVKVEFGPGHRWAERLGFSVETPLAVGWGADGGSYTLYVRHNG